MKAKLILFVVMMLMISSVFASGININVNTIANNEKEKLYYNIEQEVQSVAVYNEEKPTLPLSGDDEVDQENTHSGGGALFVWDEVYAAQSFKPTLNILTRVELYCSEYFQNAQEDVVVSIRSNPDGNDLTSVSVPPGNLPDWDWYIFDFPDISVTPESLYFIVMQTENPVQEYAWVMDDQNNYQRGAGYYWKSEHGWQQLKYHPDLDKVYYDFCFKTYGTDNLPPNTPSDPIPEDGATDVNINHDLSWTGGDPVGDTVYYDVYFGTSSPPVDKVSNDQEETTYDPGTMQYNTKYYWKIEAEDEYGEPANPQGSEWDFTTGSEPPPNSPVVITTGTKNIKARSATLKGKLLEDGDEKCDVGFYIRLWVGYPPRTEWKKFWLSEKYEEGKEFEYTVTDLIPNYYYAFYALAKNSAGEAEGETDDFTTLPVSLPEATTLKATNVDSYFVTLNGRVKNDGGDPGHCKGGFKYRNVGAETWKKTDFEGTYSTNDEFSKNIDDLTPGLKYEYKAGVSNYKGTGWGETKQFITNFTFVHITDPHVVSGGGDHFEAVLNTIKSLPEKPKFVLCSGDLVDWGADDYPDFSGTYNYIEFIDHIHKKQVSGDKWPWYIDAGYEIPIFLCPGNHDARGRGPWGAFWPFKSLFNYKEGIYEKEDYEVKKGLCAIYSLFSGYDCIPWGGFPFEHPLPWGDITGIPEGDGLDQSQIDKLRNWLDNLDGVKNGSDSSDYFKIIMLHHPRVNPDVDYDNKDGVFWENRDEFKKLCNDFKVHFVVSGHLHWGHNEVTDINGSSWSPGETMWIYTPSVQDYTGMDPIKVVPVPNRGGIDYEIIVKDTLFCESVINFDIQCKTNASVTDDENNYVGLNETGDILLNIPGAEYTRWVYEYVNETIGININKTITDVSLYRDRSKNYDLEIDSIVDDNMNFTIEVHLKNGMWSKAFYYNISMSEGDKAYISVEEGIVDYTLRIENNGPTSEVDPDFYEGNLPPEQPNRPSGPNNPKSGEKYRYTSSGIDPDYQDRLFYKFSWGDGTESGWKGPFDSGKTAWAEKEWKSKGTYKVKVRTKDLSNVVSEWSQTLSVTVPRNRAINRPFLNFLQKYFENNPNAFPILQQLVERLELF